MVQLIKIEILKDHRRKKRYVYCEGHHDAGKISVEKLEIPQAMEDDTAIHYGRQLFINTLKKRGYEVKEE